MAGRVQRWHDRRRDTRRWAPPRALMNPRIYLPQIPRITKIDSAPRLRADLRRSLHPGRQIRLYNGAYQNRIQQEGQPARFLGGQGGPRIQLWSNYWVSPAGPLLLG